MSQLLLNSHKQKHKVPRNSLLILYINFIYVIAMILYMFFLWLNRLSYMHPIRKKYNFKEYCWKYRNFFAQVFWDFAQIFDKLKLMRVRLHHCFEAKCAATKFEKPWMSFHVFD